MKTIAMIAAAVSALTSTAHAAPLCWAWALKGNDLICEQWGPSTDGQAAAIAREAQTNNNRADTYRSDTITTNADGTTTKSTTSTTYPRYYWRYR